MLYVVMMGGWVVVVVIVIVVGICCYIGKFLVDCLYVEFKWIGVCKWVYVNYFEVGEVVWLGWGNRIVSVV